MRPCSWTRWWCLEHRRQRLSRSVFPPWDHQLMWCTWHHSAAVPQTMQPRSRAVTAARCAEVARRCFARATAVGRSCRRWRGALRRRRPAWRPLRPTAGFRRVAIHRPSAGEARRGWRSPSAGSGSAPAEWGPAEWGPALELERIRFLVSGRVVFGCHSRTSGRWLGRSDGVDGDAAAGWTRSGWLRSDRRWASLSRS